MRVLFVSRADSNGKISPIISRQGESLKNDGVTIVYFPIKGKGFTAYFKNVIPLKKFLKENNFDIIHAHYGLSAITAFLAKRKEKIVVSFMGDDLIGANDENGKLIKFSLFLVKVNKFLADKFHDFNIVKSKEMYNVLGAKNCEIIPNGVDFSRFFEIHKIEARKYLRANDDEKIILFCSDPKRKEKNYKLAKQAVKLIGDPKVRLIYVYGKDQEELLCYLNAVDCLILTSFHEGSPNVIKEAMACNIPVVSTDVGDVQQVIGKTDGCYIATFEPEDVADKIKKVLKFGKRTTGREDVKHLESSVIAKRIISIYKKLLKE